MLTEEFKRRVYEQQYLIDYRKTYGKGPFLTADACVTQSGHVLLIRRGKEYGHGLLALPGGFVNENEQIRDASVRELKEETKISDRKGEIPPSMLASFITGSELFDHPKRSLRGRIVTTAYRFVLPDSKELFTVKGSDDAEHADWYRLGDLEPQVFFEDHWSILQKMIGF
nr:NUDIX domain-containing protein [Phyllobacterium myrsinacearum]